MSTEPIDEKAVFNIARRIDSREARADYLQQVCRSDSEALARVVALLEVHDQEQSFLESPAVATPYSPTITEPRVLPKPGTAIGPYKLLQQIGEGGMGTVYMAEQTHPVQRKVALKLIKAGLDSRQVIARFEAERQALALMDHPHIARVLDAGTTAGGAPYFVMELVKGVPITKYCDEHHLTPRERLELFIPVCQAVQHAHQKGIIHRDLKPSNVLIAQYDGRPVPKVIDFGVAKATGSRLTERTMYTEFGAIVGTLEYMSPEQAEQNQLDVDTRSDVYSLGVLLYELLTGTTPLDRKRLKDAALLELLRLIKEDEPPKPSTRLSTTEELPSIAANRSLEPKKLSGLVRGELDWIVMKALEKDRDRRYGSAEALSADVHRYLDDQPINACPPSTAYRLWKFVRRNRVSVSIAALVTALLLSAGSIGWLAYLGERRHAELADKMHHADKQREREQWAHDFEIPKVERLSIEHPVAAFRLAEAVRKMLPDEPRLKAFWEKRTDVATILIEPPGTRVSIRDWDAPEEEWLEIGRSPLENVRLPRGELRWKFVKEGYVTMEMQCAFPSRLVESVSLSRTSDIPEGMVAISNRSVETSSDREGNVGTFFIDRFEVTNRAYQKFVDAGGYESPQYWKHEFLRADKVIPREQAMAAFRDQTGKAGPTGWSDGQFPVGEDDFPVRGVSWYEAAAFAEFCGKCLPTIHHWRRAAHGNEDFILPLSNFARQGPARIGSHPGIGTFGVYDMAGNVREWCFNEVNDAKRALRGGSWNDPLYMFHDMNADEPMARAGTYGFRCVNYLDAPPAQALAPVRRTYFEEAPASAEELAAHLRHFAYDRDMPLNAKTQSGDSETTAVYRHEIVQIDAAYGAQRFAIHLYFPRDVKPPYEAIVYVPGGGSRSMDHFAIDSKSIDPRDAQHKKTWYVDHDGEYVRGLMRTGRALCIPIYVGTFERRAVDIGDYRSVRLRTHYIQVAQDLSRAVDYLQTRRDIDSKRLIYCGFSTGARLAPILLVVEPRFSAAILISGGYPSALAVHEVEPRRYAPHVKVPVLMINGRNDAFFPVESSQLPMFRDLGSSDKQIKHFDAEHLTPFDETLKFADEWLRHRIGTDRNVSSRSDG